MYQNPGTSAGPAGQTPPIGCVRVCIRTSANEGSDTLRVKVRAFVPIFGDVDNKDTIDIRAGGRYSDTTFRYVVVISRQASLAGRGVNIYALSPVMNPSFREAVVRYTLPDPMAVRLRAYTLDGREVLSRDLGVQPAGTHEETLQLPAGQYLLRLETPYGMSSTRLTVVE